MRTWTALLVKFIMTFVFALIVFYFFVTNDIYWVIVLAMAGTAIYYLIGDLFILPSMGNIVASLGDGIFAALTAYILDILVPAFSTSISTLIWFAVLVAIGEFFFHLYLKSDDAVAPEL